MLALMAAALAGCWQPPRAVLPPGAEPRVIQQAIGVTVSRAGTVQSFDSSARTIALLESPQSVPQIYSIASGRALAPIKIGERVRLTIAEQLTVYVPPIGGAAAEGGIAPIGKDARVLSIDRSYRLLTLVHTDGGRQTFKVARNVKLNQMQPGDAVAIESMRVVALQPWQ